MNAEQLTRLFRSLEEQAEPDAAFTDALFARLEREAGGSRRRISAPWALLAAALLLAGAVGAAVAVGSGLVKLPFVVAIASTTPEPSATPMGSATPVPSESASPTPTLTTTPTLSPTVTNTPPPPMPDLVVMSFELASSTNSSFVVFNVHYQNQSSASTGTEFEVRFYVDPATPPVAGGRGS